MNTLHLTCENPDELLAGFGAGARINLQTAATEAGAYTLVTTVPLVAATRTYTYEHLAGISSTWYKVRFEDSTGANANDYGAPFQVGDETGGLLCSLYDVQQELGQSTATSDDEIIMEKIRQVSRAIERYTGRWFAPRPTNPADDVTLRFHTRYGRTLHIPRGIRRITTLGLALTDQPETGGSYTTQTAATYYIDPMASEREPNEPGLWVRFIPTGAFFYPSTFGAEITGGFGYGIVPPDVQGVAVRAVARRYIGKGAGGVAVAVGPTGTEILLPDMSGADRVTLDSYREMPAA